VAGGLYTLEDGNFRPSELTVGPWSDQAQHGGPVAALLARTVEGVPSEVPVQTVRLTIELMRPVPLVPLTTTATMVRPGKKVQLVDASLLAGDQEVARARALRIRSSAIAVPEQVPNPPSPPPPGPSVDDQETEAGVRRTAFAGAVDLRFLRGSWESAGPAKVWSRLVVPVVLGEESSPLQRVAALADFGNGLSRVLDFSTHIFINPDLTVSLCRIPDGPWIGFDMVSRVSGQGYGQAESLVFDVHGPVGRSVQSLFIEKRTDPAI
jgi:Acyl-CoA thioesterase C-terminal domain/Acyl-CoA thioesterase N-terminal domain